MVFFPDAFILRVIGRISFVIFCFLLVEGFLHTKNVNLYIKRISIWALISEVPFDLAFSGKLFDPTSQNVFFTLLSGILSIYMISLGISTFKKILLVLMIILISSLLHFDYNYLGILQIIAFYLFRNHLKWVKFSVVGILNAFFWGRMLFQSWALLAFLPISQYNGFQGRKTGRIFYSFYAVHLAFIGIIRMFI